MIYLIFRLLLFIKQIINLLNINSFIKFSSDTVIMQSLAELQNNNHPGRQINQLVQLLENDSDFIKKSKINYFSCNCKGLHEGQKLVLVCVDNQCINKGLICPVCKEENHKDHEVLHLKIFLSQLQNKIFKKSGSYQNQQEDESQMAQTKTLSQNLINLEMARKSIITNLQESIKAIAQSVKDIEKKIHQQYIRIRRVILSQKSFSSRLPRIYSALLKPISLDENGYSQIKQEIKKLTELLQKNPKKDQIKVASNAEKLVEMYVQNSQTCTTHLLSLITDLPKKIADLPIKLKNIVIDDEEKGKSQKKTIEYKFSQTLKASSVLLSENLREISLVGPEQVGGLAFIEAQDEFESEKRKINLKITGSVSDSLSLGIGDVQKIKNINFIVSQMQSDGLYGICAMGINITDIQSPTFVFSQGDIIEMTFEPKQSKITFGRRNGVQKQEIELGISEEQCKNFRFFASLLLYGDSVEIVE